MLNDHELKTVCFSIGIFSLGAVALILYQHALHTKAIVGAVQANATPVDPGASAYAAPVGPASLAGTYTPGQTQGPALPAPSVAPLTSGPNWSLSSSFAGQAGNA